MKTFKKALCIFLIVVMCLTSAPLQGFVGLEWPSLPEINFGNFELPKIDFCSWFSSKASAATEGYYAYTVTNGKATITRVNTSISGDVVIPSTLGGYSVTTIGGYAFFCCDSLTSITIPDSVTTIGDEAFYSCVSLTSITIPDSVTTIGDRAFYSCNSLTSIVVDADNPAYSSDSRGALFDKNKTILIQYPIGNTNSSFSIPDSVTTIGDGAFCYCYSLTSVTIPDSVTTIGDDAFFYCDSLTSVTIPDSVTTIGAYAFYYCDSLTSIVVDADNPAYSSDSRGALFDKNKTILIQYPIGNTNSSYSIPNSVTTIGAYAFYYCDSLTDVYYNGAEEQWKKITIGSYNDCLTSATIHYNSSGPEVTTGYKREHVVDNWKALNQSYKSEYLAGFAVPMDGTNGNPDYLIPGQSENMIPQGLAYWPEKDWVLVSSYDKNKENPSAIFALDRETGAFVAQFNMYTKDGKAWKTHAGGIGVSDNNLYITSGNGVGYFPLSDLDVPSGTVKDITRADYMIVPYLYNADEPDETAYTAYVSVSDGVLWTGNFYSDTPCGKAIGKLDILPENWFWKATDKNNSIIVGYKLSGDSSENEWTKLKNSNHAAKYVINIDNNIDCIQGIAFKKISDKRYNLYLSRTTDASFGALISVSTINLDKNKIDLEEEDCRYLKNLPGTEGIAFIGDDLHVVYESGALSNYKEFLNQAIWNQYFKDCTDVIWKVNESDLLSIPDVKEEWFEKTDGAYSGYNHELAQFCADFSLVGYSYNENDYRYYFDKAGFTLRDCEVEAGRDEVNFFIADKTINVNGVDKNLIFVGCIGSYQNQWYSDFDPLGKDRDKEYADKSENYLTHISFADAREYVYGKLEKYIKNNPDSIILLTGHSRGAATVNVLAAKLIDNASTLGLNANNIYTYGFATPNTVHTSMGPMFNKYKSIINIVNPEDFVTKVLLTKWGYARYGMTYTLPSKTNDKNYSKYLKEMRTLFKQYTAGVLYDPYKMGEEKTYEAIKTFGDNVKTMDDFYEEEFWYSKSWELGRIYKSPYKFFKETLLNYLVTKNMDEIKSVVMNCGPFYLDMILYFAWPDINSGKALDAIVSERKVLDGVKLGGKFEHAHMMETYAAYINSMTSDEVTEVVRESHKGTVNCPVDIEIYDKETGELVGRIVNNIVDEEIAAKENSIVMSVDGDSKSFWLPSNGDYDIKLIGNDEGTMDYTMGEVDSDIGEVKRVNFFDVEITDGLKMTADVEGEDFVIEEHELIFEDGETLEPTEIFTEKDIETYNINISASEGGSASSSQTAKSGDYVSLDAIVEEGWKFAGWYENDELISTDTTLTFVAKSDRNLEAKFEHIDHSFNDWYEVTLATCETSGTEQRDCSECDYSETKEIPATGHDFDGSKCKNCDYDKADTCGCNCHKGGIAGFFFKLILFFQKIFKTNQICEGCGIKHY